MAIRRRFSQGFAPSSLACFHLDVMSSSLTSSPQAIAPQRVVADLRFLKCTQWTSSPQALPRLLSSGVCRRTSLASLHAARECCGRACLNFAFRTPFVHLLFCNHLKQGSLPAYLPSFFFFFFFNPLQFFLLLPLFICHWTASSMFLRNQSQPFP